MLKVQFSLVCLPFFLLAIGCGGPPSGQVSGKVTFKGETLALGSIIFMPETPNSPYAQAEIAPDGTYVAMTDELGENIPLGNYRVMISAVKDMGPESPVEPLLPLKYSSDSQSGLSVNVKEGINTADFALVP